MVWLKRWHPSKNDGTLQSDGSEKCSTTPGSNMAVTSFKFLFCLSAKPFAPVLIVFWSEKT